MLAQIFWSLLSVFCEFQSIIKTYVWQSALICWLNIESFCTFWVILLIRRCTLLRRGSELLIWEAVITHPPIAQSWKGVFLFKISLKYLDKYCSSLKYSFTFPTQYQWGDRGGALYLGDFYQTVSKSALWVLCT